MSSPQKCYENMPDGVKLTDEQTDKLSILDALQSLDEFEEKEADWLIPGYIPSGVITTMAGDGGCGKSSVWVNIAAAVSNGKKCFIDPTPDEFFDREPREVIFFSSEDSVEIVLKKRLRAAGANMKNIYTVSLQDPRFSDIKFGQTGLDNIILGKRPALVIFDPIQGFVPSETNMGSRNEMRNLLAPVIGVAETTGTAILLIVHTNKRSGVYGRNRIADSADIWDISRSVLIVGKTSDGTRYLSHEKSNYSEPGQTVLFDIDDGLPVFRENCDLHDCDFVRHEGFETKQAPQRQEAEEFIIDFLKKGKKITGDLDGAAKAMGISRNSLARAKTELKKNGVIGYRSEGYGAAKVWYTYLIEQKNPA